MTLQLRRLPRQILCFGGDEVGGAGGVLGQGAGGGEVAELPRAVAQDAEGRGVGRLVGALRGLPYVAERLSRGVCGAPPRISGESPRFPAPGRPPRPRGFSRRARHSRRPDRRSAHPVYTRRISCSMPSLIPRCLWSDINRSIIAWGNSFFNCKNGGSRSARSAGATRSRHWWQWPG